LDSFQSKHHGFVEEHALPVKNEDKVLIKYFAALENVIEKGVI